MNSIIFFSFAFFLFSFVIIGIASFYKSRSTKSDYYIAERTISPWLVGLSAVATANSGYMFIGVIGFTYITGLASIWLMFGWIIGDFLASIFVHSRFRQMSEINQSLSYGDLLSNWYGKNGEFLQKVIGIISLIFLITYAAAQLIASGKALYVLFNWPVWTGALIGSTIIALYCIFGGIRASIWTDTVQSIVMFISMLILLLVALHSLGGISNSLVKLSSIDGFLNLFPENLILPGFSGKLLFFLGWIFAGLSVIGQPHIMVRFMTLDKVENMGKARLSYYVWFTLFYSFATGVGLLSRVLLPENNSFDPEMALPTIALELLNPFFIGLIFAGIFAATISTADSLILSCSATLTNDLFKKIASIFYVKVGTLAIIILSFFIATLGPKSVFSLVILSWSGLASAFAPLLLFYCIGFRPSQKISLLAIFIGLFISLIWRYFNLHNQIYEGLPGILSGLLILLFFTKNKWKDS